MYVHNGRYAVGLDLQRLHNLSSGFCLVYCDKTGEGDVTPTNTTAAITKNTATSATAITHFAWPVSAYSVAVSIGSQPQMET